MSKKKLLKLTRIDLGIIGAAILAAPAFWVVTYFFMQPPFDPAWPLSDAKRFLFLVFIIPVTEELCFRGVIQPYLFRKTSKRYLYNQVSLANLATSALFVSLHLVQHPLAWSMAMFLPSLMFGWLRERTGLTWPAVTMHVYYNFGYFYFLNGL
jgi:membrane protease YdiL (CAAX protease family)